MATHSAVATVGIKKPLAIIQVPTVTPQGDEVRVRVEWTASTPLDLHQNDGGLLVTHPQVLGDGAAGTVVEVGEGVKRLKVGDKVFGFTWREQKEKAQQEFCTAPEWLFSLLPDGFTLAEAVTLPNNFVTAFHALTKHLELELPWPKPEGYAPTPCSIAIIIWGGSSSVGQFAIQILRWYGFTNIITVASKKHHQKLNALGAKWTFDYNDKHVVSSVLNTGSSQITTGSRAGIPLIFDCIGSKDGSIRPLSKIAKRGAKVAVLLPVIVRDSSDTVDPEYEMDVSKTADWNKEVEVTGVRTHFYTDNEFFKYHLQPEIMYTMLKERAVRPNNQRIIEGKTLLERAQNALDTLRRKEVSGERLVWRVAEES
ncbi:GroES-like protein [Aaosphaeria arxii CBS 175.79]|uniref:GroES-like protein n=1 Tax=Aaosphaeria arxii CBS 175.79 TaxID=1450172 RepID=A0A6A5Y3W3_9PLEO|nr:GroES-like protein [Aaosphaeria arxii CBS 175.79]KAF2020178.1 GroES-like protein [Aaosphaeria arxii CBS 175.79]